MKWKQYLFPIGFQGISSFAGNVMEVFLINGMFNMRVVANWMADRLWFLFKLSKTIQVWLKSSSFSLKDCNMTLHYALTASYRLKNCNTKSKLEQQVHNMQIKWSADQENRRISYNFRTLVHHAKWKTQENFNCF